MIAPLPRPLFLVSSSVLLLLAILSPTSTQAGVMMLTQQGSADLDNLMIGQMVTIDVLLKDLSPGESLDYLAATIEFSNSLLGTPSNLIEGIIVPDLNGLELSESPGKADGNYDVLFALGSPIVDNGVFFSFTVTALAAGSGVIDFSFLTAEGPAGPVSIAADVPLSYTIVTTAAIPEPSSLIIFMIPTALYCFRRNSRA